MVGALCCGKHDNVPYETGQISTTAVEGGAAEWSASVKVGANRFLKKCSQNDTEATATQHMKAAAKGESTASTIGLIFVNTGACVTTPFGSYDQTEMMPHYMLTVRGGV